MKNDVEFKYAGGGFDVSHDPYTSSFGRPFRQEIRINCFSSGSKTFVKNAGYPELGRTRSFLR